MEFPTYLDEVRRQADALRAAVLIAGPAATVPTCPEWTVNTLVRHVARGQNMVTMALDLEPGSEAPRPQRPPEEWDALLPWWDEQVVVLLTELGKRGPDVPAWAFGLEGNSGFWARRQAHETAVHRLDAEHALAASAAPTAVPTLVFEPEFAADGVDEALVQMVPRVVPRYQPDLGGTVLYHAADAGRAWLVRLTPGAVPEVGPATESAVDTDASVVGTADAVYRATWGRPSTAVVNGDQALVAALRIP